MRRRGAGGEGWIGAAGSAGCSSSDALLSQQLPGPCCSPGRVWCPGVCPVGLSLGRALLQSLGLPGSCLVSLFPTERWGPQVTQILLSLSLGA